MHRCGDEAAWWRKAGLDPVVSARVLWLNTHPLPATSEKIKDSERAAHVGAVGGDQSNSKRDRPLNQGTVYRSQLFRRAFQSESTAADPRHGGTVRQKLTGGLRFGFEEAQNVAINLLRRLHRNELDPSNIVIYARHCAGNKNIANSLFEAETQKASTAMIERCVRARTNRLANLYFLMSLNEFF